MILIKNAKALNPGGGWEREADILIDNGIIAKIAAPGTIEETKGMTVIEGKGLAAAPGLMDVHVHFRDPGLTYKEDIHTGAAAAARGGYTAVVCMANTKPPVDNVETLEYVLEEGKKTGIHVYQAAAVSKGMQGKELTDMEELKACGAVGFTDDGIPLVNEVLVKKAMEEAARLQVPLSFHEEYPGFIGSSGVNEGKISAQMGLKGASALAEDALVARDCMIALHTGADIDIQHISSGSSVKMVKLAKELGAKVWAEVTPHHFTLTEEAVLKHKTLAKMNPPLRTEKDRQAILEGLKGGTIDMIATDHAPHSQEEKEKEFIKAPSGIIGLETALSLAVTYLVRPGHLTLLQLMEKMSLNPARMYHMDYGYLEEGRPADVVVFAPEEQWVVGNYASKASNSPFTGETLYGKIKATICQGKVVYEDGICRE